MVYIEKNYGIYKEYLTIKKASIKILNRNIKLFL